MGIITVGKMYRFKNEERSSLRDELKGKIFKIFSANSLQAYNQDGSIILNANGQPFFLIHLDRSLYKNVDFSYVGIEPITHLKKFSLV